MRYSVCVCSTLLLTVSPACRAWDGCGHKTVAAVALTQLDEATSNKVAAIFAGDPRGRHFIDAATWPDDIKQGLRNDLAVKAPLDRSWHFVDLPFKATPDQFGQVMTNGGKQVVIGQDNSANVVTAIAFYKTQLQAGEGDATAKAYALRWLIHLVGDVHQPLHCVTVLAPLPNYKPPQKGDAGGNGFEVQHPARELHALWDDTFDEPTGGPHEEGRDSSDDTAIAIAKDLVSRIQPDPAALARMDPADWANESYSFRAFAYSPPLVAHSSAQNPPHTITPDYLTQARADAEQRVVLAGCRLAKLLSSIGGGAQP